MAWPCRRVTPSRRLVAGARTLPSTLPAWPAWPVPFGTCDASPGEGREPRPGAVAVAGRMVAAGARLAEGELGDGLGGVGLLEPQHVVALAWWPVGRQRQDGMMPAYGDMDRKRLARVSIRLWLKPLSTVRFVVTPATMPFSFEGVGEPGALRLGDHLLDEGLLAADAGQVALPPRSASARPA